MGELSVKGRPEMTQQYPTEIGLAFLHLMRTLSGEAVLFLLVYLHRLHCILEAT
jgi:hypothetical protein